MDPVMAGYNIARLVSQPPLNNIAIDDVAHNAFNFNLKEKNAFNFERAISMLSQRLFSFKSS